MSDRQSGQKPIITIRMPADVVAAADAEAAKLGLSRTKFFNRVAVEWLSSRSGAIPLNSAAAKNLSQR
ncbi:MAG: hypothetical protein J0I42_13370 [Bosea sp.]|uniref:hypothetical protein n=1 Tax=Bosea sp. (in: a-proteobacteria) TaxID=1871050 RepID=UPI001ACFCBE1|nr:hypothetical protein [Bosea sp. (in: a-proteobacteria)]MBN9452932.1 hypothetical protein [Bosea sp. (in: a-proteobacteria)]